MNMKRIVVAGTITALLLGLAGTGTALVRMHGKVCALEQERAQLEQKVKDAAVAARKASKRAAQARSVKATSARKQPEKPAGDSGSSGSSGPFFEYAVKNGEDIVTIAIKFAVSPSALMDLNDIKPGDEVELGRVIKVPGSRIADGEQPPPGSDERATPEAMPDMKVLSTAYDGEGTLRVHLSRRPDMDVIRHYVSVSPMHEGGLTFEYDTDYNSDKKCWEPVVVIRGEYAHRTYVKLRVKKGLPPHGKGLNPHPEGALRDDYVYTFTRKDRDPYVNFADGGRYLPPGGKRLLKLESVNVGKIRANVRRVEPRNVVQLLAREEGVYSRYEWDKDIDDKETGELAGDGEESKMTPPNKLNEKEFTALPVKVNDGKATNGVFLVSILNADKPQREYRWDDGYNPCRYRLVCLSDLGLSVRSSGEDGIGV